MTECDTLQIPVIDIAAFKTGTPAQRAAIAAKVDRAASKVGFMQITGALLINLGDMLARWTNDRWLSTMHRVLPPVDAQGRAVRRRSAAYFHDGNYDAVIACLPGCSDANHPALYEPITVGEHLEAKLRGSRGLTLNATAEREAARLRKGDSL